MTACCEHCQAQFMPRKASTRFCSKRCAGLNQAANRRAQIDHVARFWGGVDRRSGNECWNWQRGTSGGYGRVRFFGEQLGAHVVSYRISYGEVPVGKMVLHKCGNRLCCNPAHLYAGGHSQNTSDAVRHGTHKCGFSIGARHHASKLDPEKVIAIRNRLDQGEAQRAIASEYGVTQDTISSLKLRKTWRHV